jgi:sugar phosphate isomerase/epimerase
MFKIAAFGDEIDGDIEEQARVFNEEGIKYLELRVWRDSTLIDLSLDEQKEMKDVIDRNGLIVADIASPIGKVFVGDDFNEHFESFRKYVDAADLFETDLIRVFSYYLPQDHPPEEFSDEVISRMKRKAEYAADRGKTLIMENERWLYGNIGDRCLKILEAVNLPSLRLAFDPQNFLAEGEIPFTQNFEKLADYIAHVHIKDGKLNEPDTFVYAGTGDGQLQELLRALKERNYQGFLSLEPHLGIFGEGSGKDERIRLFRQALNALRGLAEEIQSDS